MSQDTTDETSPAPPKNPRAKLLKFALVALGLGVVVISLHQLLGPQIKSTAVQFTEWVESLGVWAPVAFIVGYVVFTVALIPGSILTMAGGALFGLFYGTVYVTLGAVTGATCAFLISRYLVRGKFEEKLASHEKWGAIDKAVEKQGGKIVLLLRLSPVFPFTYLNYALGLTSVRTLDFVWASVGMIPGTFLYVYYGKTLGDIASIAAGASPERGPAEWAFFAVGLAATIAVTAYVTRLARRALEEATDD